MVRLSVERGKVVLLDECVSSRLKEYLIKGGVSDYPIISISSFNRGVYRGVSDQFVTGFCLAVGAVLVTSDVQFYDDYPLRKVYHYPGNWRRTLEDVLFYHER